jgi:hypothetical protein
MSLLDDAHHQPPLADAAGGDPEPADGTGAGAEVIDLPPPRPTRTPAARAIGTLLLALALAALLCADSLVQVAERQPFGPRRDTALAITRPIRSASHAVGLHLPRLWLAELTGNDTLPTSAAGGDLDVPSATVPPGDGGNGGGRRGASGGPGTTAPPTTSTTLPLRRTPTAEAPLNVVLFGDSLMGHLALGFERHVAADARIHVYSEYHIGTGLARPDVLDWPTYLHDVVMPGFDPEVVYLAFGGNDDQPMQTPAGTTVALGTPEWEAEYARRVALVMDVAAEDDRTVVWIGMPAMDRERLEGARQVMNRIAEAQAALRPRVVYLDIGTVLTPGGTFQQHLTLPDGSTLRAREGDGVHVSIVGGEHLAPTLLAAIATDWNLVTPATTTTPGTTEPGSPESRGRS